MSDLNAVNDQMLEMFLFEMSSLLEQLDEILLDSEKKQSLTPDAVNEIFRIMHTIKGSSAMMDFNLISTVTHKLEDTFFYIRENGTAGIDQDHFSRLFDLILEATDFLKTQLDAIQNGDELAQGNDDLIHRVVSFLGELNGKGAPAPAVAPAAPAPAPAVPAPAPVVPAATSEPSGKPSTQAGLGYYYRADILFDEDCGMENLRAFMLVTSLRTSCNIVSFDPPDIESNTETASYILINGFTIILESELEADALQAMIEESMHVKSASITMLDSLPGFDAGTEVISGDVYNVSILFEEDCGMENLRAFMLINSLRSSCKIVSFDPPDIESNPQTASQIMQNGFIMTLETPQSQASLQGFLDNSLHVRTAKVTFVSKGEPSAAPAAPVPADSPAAPAQQAAAPEAAPPATSTAPAPAAAPVAPAAPAARTAAAPVSGKPIKQNLINVSLSKLDELMDIMGELVITESMVTRSPDLKGLTKLDNFNKSARQLLKLTDELQDMVMSIRMVPVAATFQKMQRIVRDMCRSLGKEADLVTMGEETDIDKTIIDGIGDPIMHLVRNSMDHGLESPEERIAAGKNPKGTLTLSAQNTGGEILITVSDDGKGLDAEKLIAKAKANGILTKPASEYTEKEAFMLLTMPGFSMKENVTEYSGRGVGMDVVKKNIEKIGGSVVIESKKGYGMSVFLKIPLTLAIVDGMDVSVGGGIYTLQITAINESFKATADQVIVDTEGNEMIMIRGDVYPIIRIHQLYDVPDALTNIEDGILIWVQSGDRSACLFVDQLIGEQQIVVKPLPMYLNRYDIKPYGISGCTILGDGNISLILDVGSIIEKVMEKR